MLSYSSLVTKNVNNKRVLAQIPVVVRLQCYVGWHQVFFVLVGSPAFSAVTRRHQGT
jgi:hypothetical protein